MGTGTNVQRRLVALHHLDAPWKPAEVEQREGRILRQGNDNEEVAIYRYVTEGSFDAYMWQALETKARFIAQVITGESAVRRAEDIGSQELSYAEVKAIASGNPAVLTLAEADAELKRLAILKKNHADEQYLARRSIRELPDAINRLTTRVADLTEDRATLAAHAGDPITIGDQAYAEQDVLKPLGKQLNALPDKVHETRPVPLGTYRGLRFGLVLYPHGAPDAFLEGATTRHASLSRDSHGPRAVLNALDRLAGSYDAQAATARKDLAIAEGQLRDYQARLGQPFAHDAYLAELTGLRDELKAALSEAAPEQSLPPAAEVAQRIQALKAAHVVEATPERPGTRSTRTAEEPVTTRIRRRGASPRYSPWTSFLRRRLSRPAGRRPTRRARLRNPHLPRFRFHAWTWLLPSSKSVWNRARARFHLNDDQLAMAQATSFTPTPMDEVATERRIKRSPYDKLPLHATADQIKHRKPQLIEMLVGCVDQ